MCEHSAVCPRRAARLAGFGPVTWCRVRAVLWETFDAAFGVCSQAAAMCLVQTAITGAPCSTKRNGRNRRHLSMREDASPGS